MFSHFAIDTIHTPLRRWFSEWQSFRIAVTNVRAMRGTWKPKSLPKDDDVDGNSWREREKKMVCMEVINRTLLNLNVVTLDQLYIILILLFIINSASETTPSPSCHGIFIIAPVTHSAYLFIRRMTNKQLISNLPHSGHTMMRGRALFSSFLRTSLAWRANKTGKKIAKLYLNSETVLFAPTDTPSHYPFLWLLLLFCVEYLDGDLYIMDNFLLLPSRSKNSITSLKSFSLRLVARKWHSRIKCGQPHSAARCTHHSSLPFNLSQNLSAIALRIRKPLDGECLASVRHELERVGREICTWEEEEERPRKKCERNPMTVVGFVFFIIFISSAIDSVSVLAHYALFYFFCAATIFFISVVSSGLSVR